MLKNYFKVAFRNLIRNKFYSSINIAGLSIGIAVSMLIMFYVFDELSYDRFHKDADQIYQVYMKARIQGKSEGGTNTCAPIASASLGQVYKAKINNSYLAVKVQRPNLYFLIRRDVVILRFLGTFLSPSKSCSCLFSPDIY